MKITLEPHKSRVIEFYPVDDKKIPKELFSEENREIDFYPKYPVPFSIKYMTVIRQYGDVYWVGGKDGLYRYCESEKYEYDRVMYFSADRDLQDNHVLSIVGDKNEIFVRTETSVSHITLKNMTMEEKANGMLRETVDIIDRFGMVSQRGLREPWRKDKPMPFADSDNDGGFTASFCIGETLHYAVLKKEKGENDPETQKVKKQAVRSLEACLLLMFIHGRNNGFVARTYITADAPLPDDGLFFRRCGNEAIILETTYTKSLGLVGIRCDASHPIPERLRHLYTEKGYTDDDIIFKGDTSSDETTLHIMNFYYAHLIFGKEDEELDELIKTATAGLINHIIDNNYELVDFNGEPTSWARWSKRYFKDGIGRNDAPLNAAEILMYLKAGSEICGKNERWENEYNRLISIGYSALPALHYERESIACIGNGCEVTEDIMYGDHMLANLSFFGLMLWEKNEERKRDYLAGWKSWRNTTMAREHHPVYDIPFAVACPDEYINEEKIKMWFYRSNCSAFAGGVSLDRRRDAATKEYHAGYKQTSYLLPPDERAISKYDRDSLCFINEMSGGKNTVETCSPFTFPYWMGRFYGVIKEGTDSEA